MSLPSGIKRNRTMTERKNRFGSFSTYDHTTKEAEFNDLWLKLRKENALPGYDEFMTLKNEDIMEALLKLKEHANNIEESE